MTAATGGAEATGPAAEADTGRGGFGEVFARIKAAQSKHWTL
jgi:hypothetical protein